jgi:uncharacterized SAM-binding protein YcdF (DUF218 family)
MPILESSDEVLSQAQIIWDYLGQQQELPETADVIIAGGSRDLYVPQEAARIFGACAAKWLVVSGHLHTQLGENEADAYEREAINHGVPPGAIIKEREASNTGQNITFSEQSLLGRGIAPPEEVVLVHTPIMTLRFLATAEAQWQGRPQPRFISRHEAVDFATYAARPDTGDTIPRMLGYVAHMKSHFEAGFQTWRAVPPEVQAARGTLLSLGYTSRGLHD